MPRKAVEAAAVAVAPPAAAPKSWTGPAVDAEAKALLAKRKAARDAALVRRSTALRLVLACPTVRPCSSVRLFLQRPRVVLTLTLPFILPF